jgi:hypothetical protein
VEDEGTVEQLASNDPYAHWAWNSKAASSSLSYDCVLAYSSYSYDLYLGTGSDVQQSGQAALAAATASLPAGTVHLTCCLCDAWSLFSSPPRPLAPAPCH